MHIIIIIGYVCNTNNYRGIWITSWVDCAIRSIWLRLVTMNYKPRYPQPFTLTEAVSLDVSVITEGWLLVVLWSLSDKSLSCFAEIARLQNSLQHLRQTQQGLREYLESELPGNADPEISKALEENEAVMCVSMVSILQVWRDVLVVALKKNVYQFWKWP